MRKTVFTLDIWVVSIQFSLKSGAASVYMMTPIASSEMKFTVPTVWRHAFVELSVGNDIPCTTAGYIKYHVVWQMYFRITEDGD